MIKYYCGGRGSSSSGGGRFGRGGGLNLANIVSTTSLISARNGGYRDEVDQVLTVARNIQNEYGVNLDYDIATLKGKDAQGTLGYYDGSNLAINQNYLNVDKMNKTYDASVESGYHPSRGNKSGLEAVTSHEMGHKLTDEIGKKMGLGSWKLEEASDRVLKEASKKAGYKNATYKLASKVSGYAKSSKAEALAEAFADVYCNGSKASKESKAVVDVMNSYFKK